MAEEKNANVRNVFTVLSEDGRQIFNIVNFGIICSIVSVVGITGNVLNIIIFYKQGFNITVNIAFFGLAISDMFCLTSLLWTSICMNPLLFVPSQIHWFPLEVMYLSGSWPHICFSRITSFITIYLTAERYLSIAIPLKVKHIITSKVTTLTLCVIFMVNIVTIVPEYATSYLGWRFVPSINKTMIALLFTSNRGSVEGVVYAFHSLLGMSSFGGVIIFTLLLVNKLGQNTKWRESVTTNSTRQSTLSSRDAKTVKMVILIACILIACYTPGVIIAFTSLIVGKEFGIQGMHVNICEALWSIAFSVQSLNSSVNIILYYTMSSNYRQTFHRILCLRNERNGII